MSTVRSPKGNAVKYGNTEKYIPTPGTRSVIFSNTPNSNDATVNGLTIPSGQSWTIDVYPNETIGGQYVITTTGGEELEILEFS